MSDVTPAPLAFDATLDRSQALDALAAVFPLDRREQMDALISDQDIATLRHLIKQGFGENTLRALASDLSYLEAWSLASTKAPLPWPAPEALLIKFVAHHLWDPAKRETDPSHGMPADIEIALKAQGFLRTIGPHAPATVQRRLTSWSTLTRWRGLEGNFADNGIKTALRLAKRTSARPRQRKSEKAVVIDVLSKLIKTCSSDSLVDLRDKALLLTAFASGGRRRSEIANLRVSQLIDQEPVPSGSSDPDATPLPCLRINLGRTKTTEADDDAYALLTGSPVVALKAWLARARIKDGAVFRGIDQWGNLKQTPLSPQSVNAILKSRIAEAGLDPNSFSAHGLRSGYLTEAARSGVPLPEAMQQSQHKSVNQAARYYNDNDRRSGKAARLLA